MLLEAGTFMMKLFDLWNIELPLHVNLMVFLHLVLFDL